MRLTTLRRTTQIGFFLFFLLMPVFNILRYDAYTKDFFLFGTKWNLGIDSVVLNSDALSASTEVAGTFFVKVILPWLGALAFFPALGFFFGRTFCGWFCPEGFLFEIADWFSKKILGRKDLFGRTLPEDRPSTKRRVGFAVLALLFYTVVPPFLGLMLSGYFVSPSTLLQQAMTFEFSTGVRAAMVGLWVYVIATSVLLRHIFCKYICAPGLMQVLFGWISPVALKVRFKREEISRCTDCKMCEKVCFMDVKPRASKPNINCVNCGECIVACKEQLGDSLFEFLFGRKNRKVNSLSHPHQSKIN